MVKNMRVLLLCMTLAITLFLSINTASAGSDSYSMNFIISITEEQEVISITTTAKHPGSSANLDAYTDIPGASWSVSRLGMWDFSTGPSTWSMVLGLLTLVVAAIVIRSVIISFGEGMVGADSVVVVCLVSLFLVIIAALVPIVGDSLNNTGNVDDYNVNVFTLTASPEFGLSVWIGTEQYTFTDGTSGKYEVDISVSQNTTWAAAQLANEINSNSTLVTAA